MGKEVVTTPSVGVVIVAFNDPVNITRLLPSLAKTTGDFTLHTIVVDNSTDDAAAAQIKSIVTSAPATLHASYHAQTENRGFAGGVNAGLKLADTDYIWLLNSDTTVDSNAIQTLITTAQTTNAAVVGSRILYADDKTVYYAGGYAANWLGIVRHPGRNLPASTTDSTRTVTFVNGCAFFMPAQTVKKYGALFEPYFLYYEETDYCARIIAKGGALYYEPTSIVHHHTAHTDDKTPTSVYFLTRNHWLYVARTIHGAKRLTAVLAIAIFQLYRFVRYSNKPDLRSAIVRGWRDAVAHRYGKKTT